MHINQEYGQNENGMQYFKSNKERNIDEIQINHVKEQDSATLRNTQNKIEISMEQ